MAGPLRLVAVYQRVRLCVTFNKQSILSGKCASGHKLHSHSTVFCAHSHTAACMPPHTTQQPSRRGSTTALTQVLSMLPRDSHRPSAVWQLCSGPGVDQPPDAVQTA